MSNSDRGLVSRPAFLRFVLSGFNLSHNHPVAGAKLAFICRRIGRIWPVHVVTLLICLMLQHDRRAGGAHLPIMTLEALITGDSSAQPVIVVVALTSGG
jgi:hypothetical protein